MEKDNIDEFYLDVDYIKKRIYIKNVKGNDYYYYKSPFVRINESGKRVRKLYSLGNINMSDDELKAKFKEISNRDVKFFLDYAFDLFKSIYKTKYLNEVENKKLALLRLTYSGLLSQYNESDLEKYKEKCYTEYVYGTTSIEGNTYSLRETDITLNEGQTVSGKESREFYEIENYSKLQEYYDRVNLDKKQVKITVSLIKKIHKIIMTNIDNNGGEYRNIYVGIRGTRFEPSPPIMIEDDIIELLKWYNENSVIMNPLELASIFHQRFEEIHPFTDGNGRTGREILRLILQNNDLPTVFVDNNNREEYLTCLDKGNEKQNYTLLCKFFAKNLFETHAGLLNIAREEMHKKLTN